MTGRVDPQNVEAPVLDATQHPPLRGVTLEGGQGVIGVNYKTNGSGLLGGRDKVFGQNVGVYGQSDQQGVFGHATTNTGTGVFGNTTGGGFGVRGESAEGTAIQGQSFGSGAGVVGKSIGGIGIWGISETYEGMHAETNSTTTAAIAAYQMNAGSDTAALYAKHTGKKLAGFFDGGVEITGSLTVQGLNLNTFIAQAQSFGSLAGRVQALEQQNQQLKQQITSLTARVTSLEQRGSAGGSSPSFVISVVVDQGSFVVTGSGFRPSVKCFIFVVYPDQSRKVFEDTPDSNGKLNFKVGTSSLCITGANVTLNFTVNQPDASGRDKFTNTVSKSCPT